jgi:hypothetical protein
VLFLNPQWLIKALYKLFVRHDLKERLDQLAGLHGGVPGGRGGGGGGGGGMGGGEGMTPATYRRVRSAAVELMDNAIMDDEVR